MEVQEIRDVFTGQPMEGKYDIDHFIPWSFVMNDEHLESDADGCITKFIPRVIDYQNGIRFFQKFCTKSISDVSNDL